jgi:hypothetical protein
MTGQFLLLMVFLDKFWFTPVGKVLDERDGYIREQLQKFKARCLCSPLPYKPCVELHGQPVLKDIASIMMWAFVYLFGAVCLQTHLG